MLAASTVVEKLGTIIIVKGKLWLLVSQALHGIMAFFFFFSFGVTWCNDSRYLSVT